MTMSFRLKNMGGHVPACYPAMPCR
jgi:hypothetical protein